MCGYGIFFFVPKKKYILNPTPNNQNSLFYAEIFRGSSSLQPPCFFACCLFLAGFFSICCAKAKGPTPSPSNPAKTPGKWAVPEKATPSLMLGPQRLPPLFFFGLNEVFGAKGPPPPTLTFLGPVPPPVTVPSERLPPPISWGLF